MKKRRIIFAVLFILNTIFIFSNSAKTAAMSSEQSGYLSRLFAAIFNIADIEIAAFIVRKLAHFTEFFSQAALLSVCFFEDYKKYVIYVLFAGLFTAAADEFLQLFFDGRAGMVQDIFIDFSGTVAAVIACFLVFTVIKRLKKRV